MTDVELAGRLATTTMAILRELRVGAQLPGRALGDAGDATANAFLVSALGARRPADGLLSEEEADTERRLALSRVWIIDPLDGTRDYREGRDDFAVHVALCIDGVPTVAAVAQPDRTRTTADPQAGPAWGGTPRIVVSRTRAPSVARRAAAAIGADLVPLGSAGAKVMAVVRGDAEAYVHAGGFFEWDCCAPVGVALAAGLHCSRLDGSTIAFNRPDTRVADLLVCRPELAEQLLEAVR